MFRADCYTVAAQQTIIFHMRFFFHKLDIEGETIGGTHATANAALLINFDHRITSLSVEFCILIII